MRPTIALCMIIKNEKKNLPRLLASIEGCFDEIHITDTGSDDGSVEYLMENYPKVKIHHFEWVNSFAKARNYSFSFAKTDYLMWMDGDDVLGNKDNFISWRDTGMEHADAWLNTYNYAFNKNGKPETFFKRERVFKRTINPIWNYDIHEGVILSPGSRVNKVDSWTIDHMRDQEDMNADRSRNVKILEDIKKSRGLDARLKFYYGKELFENQKSQEALTAFEEAISDEKLEIHDRILTLQYACYACLTCADHIKDEFKDEKSKYFGKSIKYCLDGIAIDPNRAEFHVAIGDTYLRQQKLLEAIPFYAAAKACTNPMQGAHSSGPVFTFKDCYGLQPTLNLAKIYFNIGRLDDAYREASEAYTKYTSDEAKVIMTELERIKLLVNLDNNQEETEEIIFSCPPQIAYPFDEEIYKTKGLGGSETALVQMAKYLKEVTGRPVKVYMPREFDYIAESGVEYLSNKELPQYFSKFKPKVHIAWRHNIELTRATTYLWCHDLLTPSVEMKQNFTKLLALTPFHKNYVMGQQGLKEDQIEVTRNGLTPEKFEFVPKIKNPLKLVWMSSPDRGLDRAMLVCDEVRKEYPIELHVYYGLENLYKYGLSAQADHLKNMMAERSWVKYHGFTEQSKMYEDVSDAVIWCHPCNFIETSCITAMEMLALNIYPVTRALGGLKDTLADARSKGWATLLEHDCANSEQIKAYADEVMRVLTLKNWEEIDFDVHSHSWKSIAEEWKEVMCL